MRAEDPMRRVVRGSIAQSSLMRAMVAALVMVTGVNQGTPVVAGNSGNPCNRDGGADARRFVGATTAGCGGVRSCPQRLVRKARLRPGGTVCFSHDCTGEVMHKAGWGAGRRSGPCRVAALAADTQNDPSVPGRSRS